VTKLYYGDGKCSISGEAAGVEINYKGAINIVDKTPDGFHIMTGNNKIMIFPFGVKDITLNNLFEYTGEFRISSVIVSDWQGKSLSTTIKRMMDYVELLDGNVEDMTIPVNKLNATYKHRANPHKTTVDKKVMENMHTSNHDGDLYLGADIYDGYYHVHLETGKAMTGDVHTEDSQELKIKIIRKPQRRMAAKRRTSMRDGNGGGY
tara:strand:+ start:6111 stop:6728 length:618 start_codon:yes stop_codon:yes gene_type:complete